METYKIEVRFELLADGRLRVWSPDVPGLLLSGQNKEAVVADVIPALETLLAHKFGKPVRVRRLTPLAEKEAGIPHPSILPQREYVTELAA